MKITKTFPNALRPSDENWVIEDSGLIVRGDTLEEAVKEFGNGMYERGQSDNQPGRF